MKRFDLSRPSRSVVIAVILVVSILLGFLIDLIWTGFEKLAYPKKYSEYVEVYAERYDVPQHIIYAVIKTESGFDSAAVSKKGANYILLFFCPFTLFSNCWQSICLTPFWNGFSGISVRIRTDLQFKLQ